MLRKLLLLIFVCLWQSGFSQQVYIIGEDNSNLLGKEWISPEAVATLKSMKLNYKKPEGFNEAYLVSECFEPNSKLALALTCISNKLYTDKGDFITFMSVIPFLSTKDIADWESTVPNFNYDIDQLHNNKLRHIMKIWYGDSAAEDWQHYLSYYSTVKAKSKFNADTAITFSITLDSAEYYDKYNYLDVFLIQKNGRGFVTFYSFYDEEGKKNLDKYKKEIEGILRFED